MRGEPNIAAVAALIGDPARAAIQLALADGRALPAGELAAFAGLSSSAASAHLSKLLEGGLLALARQGRHRYYRFAGPAARDRQYPAGTADPASRPAVPHRAFRQ
ncbi:MAG TPA: helix-turn-helix transcriptional regulator [Stellaceae bacterium]|nr:helix-turn-helix transcriptional regulator [Stellaceae bacterium]